MKKLILSVVLSLMTACFAATIYLPHPKMNSNGSLINGWFWKKYEVKNYRIENGVIEFALNGKKYRSTVFKESKNKITKVIKVWSGKEAAIHDKGFEAGAEFGYNKANEWHYPSKGELPKENQECYFIHSNYYGKGNKPIFTKSSIQVHAGVYAYALDEEGNETTDFCFYDDFIGEEMDINEVYAWKEIILPELLKESE